MADNHVASNLFMFFIIFMGYMSLKETKLEVFPEVTMDMVVVEVAYPGASPDEVEKSICIKIEEQLESIDGIERITSVANENIGVVTAELELGESISDIKDKIKSEIDRITTFPENAEQPVVRESVKKNQVIQVAVTGDLDEVALKNFARNLKDEMLEQKNISQIDISGVRNYEISIELSERNMQSFGISFDEVTRAIQMGSLDLPSGSVETTGGEISIRTAGLGYTKSDYDQIVVRSRPNGDIVYLKDIATVVDGFEESDLSSFYDGKRAAMLSVFRVGNESAVDVSDAVKAFIKEKQSVLPEGIYVDYWYDEARILRDRIDLLVRNARMGLILVILSLALFLDIRLAMWTAVGIVVSFMGAFIGLSMFDVSINMISLFAFILVLGIVVDDAIVVGENIFTFREVGETGPNAAKKGVLQVTTPVIFSVSTTIAAFSPLLFVDGFLGKFMVVIPVIVISVLFLSLVESLWILPSHLSSIKDKSTSKIVQYSKRITHVVDEKLDTFIQGWYTEFLKDSLKKRALVISISVSLFIVSIGLVAGGIVQQTFFPEIDGDNMIARLTMPQGTTIEQTREVVERIERAADQVKNEFNQKRTRDKTSVFRHLYSTVGDQPMARRQDQGGSGTIVLRPNTAEINVELLPAEERDASTREMLDRWREVTGEIPGVETLQFTANLMSSGADIQFNLSAEKFSDLQVAITELKDTLRNYGGVRDIRDDFQEGKYELKIKLKDSATPLGITLADLARQVRAGFYGAEAFRLQRGEDEVKVMVRYPKAERKSITDIEQMRIRTLAGVEVSFHEIAEVEYGRGYSTIKRAAGRRVISVTADVDESVVNANEVNADIMTHVIPMLEQKYKGFRYTKEGAQKEQEKAQKSLGNGFMISMFVIFALLAIPFKSYVQPLIVMIAIPFGLIGAIWGHFFLGYELSMMSAFGLVALAGIVVNDSLVLVDFINSERSKGVPMYDAIVVGCQKRFRPILLTSLTTFLGLFPMMMEQSLQAQFLIPMAISLGFGVLFATAICLVLVPVSVLIVHNMETRIKNFRAERSAQLTGGN